MAAFFVVAARGTLIALDERMSRMFIGRSIAARRDQDSDAAGHTPRRITGKAILVGTAGRAVDRFVADLSRFNPLAADNGVDAARRA
jgi:hypothetical protein